MRLISSGLILGIVAAACSSGGSGDSEADGDSTPVDPVEDPPVAEVDDEIDTGLDDFVAGIEGAVVFDDAVSPDGRLAAAVVVRTNEETDVVAPGPDGQLAFVIEDDSAQRLPAINDTGTFAYVSDTDEDGLSSLWLGEEVVLALDSSADFTATSLTNEHLVYAVWDRATGAHEVVMRSLATGEISNLNMPGKVERLIAVGSTVTAEISGPSGWRVLLIDPATGSVTDIHQARGPVRVVEASPDGFALETAEGDPAGLLLYQALRTWEEDRQGNPMAAGNNLRGGLTWAASYVLQGLVELQSITGSSVLADEVRQSVDALLATANPSTAWPTDIYGLDLDDPIPLFIGDAMVHHALLNAANSGLLTDDVRADVVARGEAFFARLQSQFDPTAELYRIARDIGFATDGVWAPLNWQSALAVTFLELAEATGNQAVRDRADALARRIRSEWDFSTGAPLWHYWPREYYAGWVESDDVSTNTPVLEPSVDELYDDVSHAGLVIKLVDVHRRVAGDAVFPDSDLDGLRALLDNVLVDGTFARFISGDIEYEAPNDNFLPAYGWSTLGDERLTEILVTGMTRNRSDDLIAYVDAIGDSEIGRVDVVRRLHEADGSETALSFQWQLGVSELAEWFGA